MSRALDTPALRLLGVRATSTYEADGPVLVDLTEDAIRNDIATSARFELSFDRFLLPHKVIRQSICLRAAADNVSSIGDCKSPFQPFAEPEYDPVLRRVTYRLPADSRLEGNTNYRLTVFVTPSTDKSGFFAFDSAPLDRPYVFDFMTRPSTDPSQNEVLPSSGQYCDAIDCFDQCVEDGNACVTNCDGSDAEKAACTIDCCNVQCGFDALDPEQRFGGVLKSCAFGQCHQPADPASPNDAMGLNLATPEALESTAINQVAHQTQQGGHATSATDAPLRFGRAMPLIDPNNPGNSFLLYKLLLHPLNHTHNQGGGPSPALLGELQRLGAGAIMGLPMPVSISGAPHGMVRTAMGDAADAEASQRAVQSVSTWIAHGAVTGCSP